MVSKGTPRILIMDTGPLITLAVADSLDYLLLPQVPVLIPDAVIYEATINSAALGAASIAEWSQSHLDLIQSVVTKTFTNQMAVLAAGGEREFDLGERAAIEVGRHTSLLESDDYALLLTEDDRVIKGSFFDPDDAHRIMVVTTHDFLLGLERAQRINSADAVYQRAEDAGRAATKRSVAAEKHDAAVAALDCLMSLQAERDVK